MSEVSAPPALRPLTIFYVALLGAAALSTGLALLVSAPPAADNRVALLVGLTAAMALAHAAPINAGHRILITLEFVALVPAVLLFSPGVAMVIALGGTLLGQVIRPRLPWIDPRLRYTSLVETIFNGSTLALQAAAMGLVAAAIGWDPNAPDFDFPMPILVVLAGGVVMYLVKHVSLAGVISFQERQPLTTVFVDATVGAQPAERVQYLAELGVGLLAAVIAAAHPWALALLLLPGAAVYAALQQHVAMRRRAEANLAAAQEVAHLGSIDWDLRDDDQQWSNALFTLFGLPQRSTQSTAASYLGVVHPDDRIAVEAAFRRVRLGEEYAIDHRIVRSDGAERFVHSRGEVVLDRAGRPRRVVGTIHDVTERKDLEARLEHQAFHDPLTDLPNRAFFTRSLDEALGRRDDGPPHIAVLFLDLDRFKLINDTLGHEAGDQLLIAVAERLRGIVRHPNDVVARLGGDEFTVLLDDVRDDAEAVGIAERIIAAMTEPITLLESREIVVSTSVGIVRPGPDYETGADVLRDADNALYRAKEGGRNRYADFDTSMGAETAERLAIEADLRHVLERDELRMLYQPKVDLATERVVAVEAFLRWDHPARGPVSPARFIPIAEETGEIGRIGAWVLATACREAATWDRITADPPILSVNLSGKQLHDPHFAADLEAVLTETGLAPRRLRLEIAETTVMKNTDATAQALGHLQEIGVSVVIDDFGTGSSSLSSLRRFPVDTLQLDHSFVADLGVDPDATKVARAVIGLAHGLGLKVVAEGVERPDQLAQLRALGCEQAQGNLFAPPLPAHELAVYLASPKRAVEAIPARNGAHESPPLERERTEVTELISTTPEADAQALQPSAHL